ncbi:MAG: thermonuclease family protein [Ignavibacteriaceae bacterium]|nr:thermonuclease family protein [Ignavibacteriaceae bacterium]
MKFFTNSKNLATLQLAGNSIFLIVLFLFLGCEQPKSNRTIPVGKKPKNVVTQEELTVTKIVDGDTFRMIYGGEDISVRLIGIDTPESRSNERAVNQATAQNTTVEEITKMGKRSAQFLRKLLPIGTKVKVELDIQKKDRYGRLLAYIYLPDGKMVNEVIVMEGYASVSTYPPNVKYEERFRDAYRYAYENQVGLFAPDSLTIYEETEK